jgi:hypothetical protein
VKGASWLSRRPGVVDAVIGILSALLVLGSLPWRAADPGSGMNDGLPQTTKA